MEDNYYHGDDAPFPDKKYYGLDGVEFERVGTISFLGQGPKNYNPDKRIWEEVCLNLTFHPSVDASEIDVNVHEGVVILSGLIWSRKMKRTAEKCIENIAGVRDIINRLQIKKSFFLNEFDEYDTY